MATLPVELDLPLGDPESDELAARRLRHLAALPGVDGQAAARLARAFPSLAAVYAASEERLRAVVGPVVAARVRWFLDAPLQASAAHPGAPGRGLRHWRDAA